MSKLRRLWRAYRHDRWLTSPAGLAYHRALDDVWNVLDSQNPCHDSIRRWIIARHQTAGPTGVFLKDDEDVKDKIRREWEDEYEPTRSVDNR